MILATGYSFHPTATPRGFDQFVMCFSTRFVSIGSEGSEGSIVRKRLLSMKGRRNSLVTPSMSIGETRVWHLGIWIVRYITKTKVTGIKRDETRR